MVLPRDPRVRRRTAGSLPAGTYSGGPTDIHPGRRARGGAVGGGDRAGDAFAGGAGRDHAGPGVDGVAIAGGQHGAEQRDTQGGAELSGDVVEGGRDALALPGQGGGDGLGGDPRVNLRPIVSGDGATILPLTRRPGGIQAYKYILPAGGDRRPDLRTHEGYDWVYVLNGTLRLVLGEDDLLLQPGEAAEFDTRTPHWFGATRAGSVEFLSLIGRQGERVHVRAAPATD